VCCLFFCVCVLPGDGRLSGSFQFNPTYSQNELCAQLSVTSLASLSSSSSMQPFCMASFHSECGNGVVEPGETCDDSSVCCGPPNSNAPCQLTAQAQCSGETPCCTACKFKSSATTCMGGTGLCQNGFCAVSACNAYGGMSYCGTEPGNPCRQRCATTSAGTTLCSSKYTSPNLAVADGVVCSTAPYSTCQAGACLASSGTGSAAVTYSWTLSDWSGCNCAGVQTRLAYCTGSDGSVGTAGKNCLESARLANSCRFLCLEHELSPCGRFLLLLSGQCRGETCFATEL
jgi:hypothetical protein